MIAIDDWHRSRDDVRGARAIATLWAWLTGALAALGVVLLAQWGAPGWDILLAVALLVGWDIGRRAVRRYLLAAATRPVRAAVFHEASRMSPHELAILVMHGAVEHRGLRLVAVQDETHVRFDAEHAPERGVDPPLASIFFRSGGGA